MEDALRGPSLRRRGEKSNVLILVLMEDALRVPVNLLNS